MKHFWDAGTNFKENSRANINVTAVYLESSLIGIYRKAVILIIMQDGLNSASWCLSKSGKEFSKQLLRFIALILNHALKRMKYGIKSNKNFVRFITNLQSIHI